MNKTAIYSTIVVSVIASLAIFAVSSSQVEAVPPSKVACPAENVQHWTYMLISATTTIMHSTVPSITGGFFLPFPTMGAEVFTFDTQLQDVADRLNELGYFVDDGGPRPVSIADIETNFATQGSSTICAEN